MERRLAAVLAADVVGYSRLMGADEEGTLARLKAARTQLIDPKIGEHHGRLVSTAGDGMLVEFSSVVEALRCAVEIQRGMQGRNAGMTESQQIQFRVGINVGDIIIDGTDIFGDGVNVAARLEAMAEPGGICVSGRVFEDARGKLDLAFEDAGEQQLKNIEWPVRVHRVRLDGGAAATPKQQAPALPDKPSVVVLPFTNMSGDPAEEYFSDGITEDITTELARFRSLFVIALNSAFSYKGRSPRTQDVGRELGVQYIVEGSVRRAGRTVRVTAQLVTATTGAHVWAERFDHEAGEIFAVQDEIVRTIVSTLVGRIDEAGKSRVKRLSSEGLRAYDLYLKALAAQDSNTPEAYADAERYLRQAIALDPDLPQAHHHLSLVKFVFVMAFWVEDRDSAFAESFAEAEQALSLDEANSSLHAHFGMLLLYRGEHDKARDHFARAMRLNPGDAKALSLCGFFLTGMHELEEALACFDQALRISPLAPNCTNWLRGIAYFTARRYADAIRSLTSVRGPMNEVNMWLAASYAHAGSVERARPVLETFLRRAETEMARCLPRELDAWRSYWHLAMPYAQEGDLTHLMEGLGKAGLGEKR